MIYINMADFPPPPPLHPQLKPEEEYPKQTKEEYQSKVYDEAQKGDYQKNKINYLRITLILNEPGNVASLENKSSFHKVELLRNTEGFADLELSAADFTGDKLSATNSKLSLFLANVDKIKPAMLGNFTKGFLGLGSKSANETSIRGTDVASPMHLGGKLKTKRKRIRSRRLTK